MWSAERQNTIQLGRHSSLNYQPPAPEAIKLENAVALLKTGTTYLRLSLTILKPLQSTLIMRTHTTTVELPIL